MCAVFSFLHTGILVFSLKCNSSALFLFVFKIFTSLPAENGSASLSRAVRLTGSEIPRAFVSSSNVVILTLRTDSSVTLQGFYAVYRGDAIFKI